MDCGRFVPAVSFINLVCSHAYEKKGLYFGFYLILYFPGPRLKCVNLGHFWPMLALSATCYLPAISRQEMVGHYQITMVSEKTYLMKKKLRWALGWFVYVWDISLKSMFVHQFNVLCISFLNTGNEEPRGSWSRKVNQGSPGSSKAIDNWSVGKEEQGRYLLYCHPFPLLSYPLSTALISDLRLMIAIETICVCNHLPLPIFFSW